MARCSEKQIKEKAKSQAGSLVLLLAHQQGKERARAWAGSRAGLGATSRPREEKRGKGERGQRWAGNRDGPGGLNRCCRPNNKRRQRGTGAPSKCLIGGQQALDGGSCCGKRKLACSCGEVVSNVLCEGRQVKGGLGWLKRSKEGWRRSSRGAS